MKSDSPMVVYDRHGFFEITSQDLLMSVSGGNQPINLNCPNPAADSDCRNLNCGFENCVCVGPNLGCTDPPPPPPPNQPCGTDTRCYLDGSCPNQSC